MGETEGGREGGKEGGRRRACAGCAIETLYLASLFDKLVARACSRSASMRSISLICDGREGGGGVVGRWATLPRWRARACVRHICAGARGNARRWACARARACMQVRACMMCARGHGTHDTGEHASGRTCGAPAC
eukprot:249353-Pleurochrysis_carterae.AAC.1